MVLGIYLFAGLGNKLFQYAFIKAYSKKHNIPFFVYAIDTNLIHNKDNYKWLLDHLNIKNYKEIPYIEVLYSNNYKYWFQPDEEYLKYIDYSSHGDIFNTHLIMGYFQSEEYFENIKDELRDELKEPAFITPYLDSYIENILGLNSSKILENVAIIHFRLGDYRESKAHFINLKNYYNKCIEKIKQTIENPIILIMAKDVNEIQEVYPDLLNNVYCTTYILPSKLEDEFIDIDCFHFYLMSRVKTIVCANSSFSWWGAWINPHSQKKIYIPSKWLINFNNIDYCLNMKGAEIIDV